MAVSITVPRLGWSMEEGLFGGWLKQPGEAVAMGEPLFLLESDKVTMEVESLDAGLLHVLDPTLEVGSVVTVGQLLGYLLAAGEAVPEFVGEEGGAPEVPVATPAVTLVAAVETGVTPRERVPASPRARAAAKRLGVDLADVSPRPGKARIIAADVEAMARPSSRAAIAARLEASFRAPHFYLQADAEAEALAAWRDRHRPASYNDLLIRAMGLALSRHPKMNAYWANGRVQARTTIDVALAAQVGENLLTPVLRDVAEKPLAQLAAERVELLERCARHEARPAEFADASATISNLGAFGVDRFQAILNPPQSVIVAVGSLKKRPVVVGDAVVARLTLPISLSVDHRVVDGVAAAEFLQTLVRLLESPETL